MSNIDQLRDEQALRREIGLALELPSKHERATSIEPGWGIVQYNYCRKCGGPLVGKCKKPAFFTGDLAIAESKLIDLVLPTDLIPVIVARKDIGIIEPRAQKALAYECYILMDPAERCAVCIEALKEKTS
jgi:hypothetical protein